MKLSKLLKNINIIYEKDIEIKNIYIDSNKVTKNSLFVAIKGYIRDGHDYIDDAINRGAIAVIVDEDRYDEYKDRPIVLLKTNNTRFICSKIACNFYNNPSKDLIIIGITGTKGKTTTSYMIRNILLKAGKNVGLISTVATYINNKKIHDNDRTTPEAFELQETFDLMKKSGCKYVVMEVSSQSIKLDRVLDVSFDIGIFLNLSRDHISKNEHSSFKDYFNCKLKLFDNTKIGFVNIDDKKGNQIVKIKDNIKTYGIKNDCDLKAYDIDINDNNTSFKVLLDEELCIKLPLLGLFNVYNALASIITCKYLKIDNKSIISGLKDISIPGRGELVPNKKGINIMIDYAHNEKSMESILELANKLVKGKIICVFGAAGDRDKEKRSKMGKIASKLANYSIITTDNPSSEDPNDICLEIQKGFISDNNEIIIDREEAIKKAISLANKNDLILLLGKGHETYQIVNDKKIPFSERKIIDEILNR